MASNFNHPRYIPHFSEAIDVSSEYCKKYVEVISSPDSTGVLHEHHVVPVAFYEDVLGEKRTRSSDTPDMVPTNLVKLSVGRHLLAHYYLMKCAKPCIRIQMINAFRCSYQTTDVSSITEAEVITRMKEIDREYAKYKDGKIPHKDGIRVIRSKNGVTVTGFKDGKKVGPFISTNSMGLVTKCGDYDTGVMWEFRNFMKARSTYAYAAKRAGVDTKSSISYGETAGADEYEVEKVRFYLDMNHKYKRFVDITVCPSGVYGSGIVSILWDICDNNRFLHNNTYEVNKPGWIENELKRVPMFNRKLIAAFASIQKLLEIIGVRCNLLLKGFENGRMSMAIRETYGNLIDEFSEADMGISAFSGLQDVINAESTKAA